MGDIRPEVERLAQWAPLPDDDNDWTEYDLERYTADAFAVKEPITTDERLALMPLLDITTEENAFGVTNVVRHLIESAPHPPYWWRDLDETKPWFAFIRMRGLNWERSNPDEVHEPDDHAAPAPR